MSIKDLLTADLVLQPGLKKYKYDNEMLHFCHLINLTIILVQ